MRLKEVITRKYLIMNQHTHCCDSMYNITVAEDDELLIIYEPNIRYYSFMMHEKPKRPNFSRKTGYCVQLFYCPWCGTELPKELDEEWGNAPGQLHEIINNKKIRF